VNETVLSFEEECCTMELVLHIARIAAFFFLAQCRSCTNNNYERMVEIETVKSTVQTVSVI
jgi:hypothetical protein